MALPSAPPFVLPPVASVAALRALPPAFPSPAATTSAVVPYIGAHLTPSAL